MYPYLLRDRLFPVALLPALPSVSPEQLIELARSFGVIARVRIETPEPEYPYRSSGRVTYPIGTFTTVLTGPEVLAVAQTGRIKSVGEHALYKLGRPFVGAVDVMLAERTVAERARDRGAGEFAKLVVNSLAGRLAIRKGKWSRACRMDSPGKWGQYHVESDDPSHRKTLRYLSGQCWEWRADVNGAGPHTAAFSYLCAYGRLMMRDIRALCPAKSVVSQDTDGLWLLPSGVGALVTAGRLGGVAPGQLRIKDSARTARFWGPRHYTVDGRWTLSGLAWDEVDPVKHRAYCTERTPMFDLVPRGAPSETVVHSHWSEIPRDLAHGEVREDGWIDPLWIGRPEALRER